MNLPFNKVIKVEHNRKQYEVVRLKNISGGTAPRRSNTSSYYDVQVVFRREPPAGSPRIAWEQLRAVKSDGKTGKEVVAKAIEKHFASEPAYMREISTLVDLAETAQSARAREVYNEAIERVNQIYIEG